MSLKQWLALLGLEIFGIAWAILVFASPMSKVTAGLLAGTVFLIVGLFPLWALRRNPQRWGWISFWSAVIFLIGSVLPILGLRLVFWGQDFNTIEIGAFKAAQLHAWSQSFYVGLLIATVLDGIRFFLLPKIKK